MGNEKYDKIQWEIYHIMQLLFLETKTNRMNDGIQDLNPSSGVLPTGNSVLSSTTPVASNNTQYAVFCSSREARVRSQR